MSCAALDVVFLLGYIYFNKYILFFKYIYILNICIYSSSNSVSLGVGIVKGRGPFFMFGEVGCFD